MRYRYKQPEVRKVDPLEEALNQIMVEESRRACEASLHEFVKQAWHVIEPGVEFVDGWHIQAICEHLEAVSRGEIRFLLINMPPRHAKSTIVSVMWPCWEWTARPSEKYLTSSYSSILSIRDNLKSRRLIQSPWYQERWGDKFHLTSDQNQKMRFENNLTGYRIASSVGGTATGEGGSRLLLDDPHGAQDAQSEALRKTAVEWFDQVWTTRLNDPNKDAMVTVMQRLHEKDVSGRILELKTWEHLCLPAEYDNRKRKTCLGPYDPRKKKGELLWPERFGEEALARIKRSLGDYGTAGQLQQSPSPAEGGILKPGYFRLWPNDRPLPPLSYVVQSYDTAHTEKKSNDPTACTVWGVFWYKKTYNVILLDAWSEFLSYPRLRTRAIRDWSASYAGDPKDPANKPRKPDLIIVEKKTSGLSLLQDLALAKAQCYGSDPGKFDKVARAHAVAPILHAGLVWAPESQEDGEWVSWAEDFKKELTLFPNVEHDDLVDTFTQVLNYLRKKGFLNLDESPRERERDDTVEIKKPRINPYDQ